MKITDLKPAPYNPRKISGESMAGLKTSLAQFGDIAGLTWNRATGHMVAGHQRLTSLKALYGDRLEIREEVNGSFWIVSPDGEKFALRVVDWTEEQERAANVAANNPHIAGEFDGTIGELLAQIEADDAELFESLRLGDLLKAEEEPERDDNYSRKIEAPIYKIKGERPAIATLIDTTKRDSLIAELAQADIPDDIKQFLHHAAERHSVFHFGRIAEFYAHADAPIQDLMERSALVVIDFDKAVEGGFVKMTEKMLELQGKDYPDEG